MIPNTKTKLTPKQELFCQFYAKDRDTFGNGALAYAKAYRLDVNNKREYFVAKSGAYENLTKPYLMDHIREIMDIQISNTVVDRELARMILQDGDLGIKLSAIREYNRVRGRGVDKQEIKLARTGFLKGIIDKIYDTADEKREIKKQESYQ